MKNNKPLRMGSSIFGGQLVDHLVDGHEILLLLLLLLLLLFCIFF